MEQTYYLGANATGCLPFDRLYLTQHYMMPMWGTLDWDKVSRQQVNANLARLDNDDDRTYQQIQMYIHIPFCNSICDYCDFNVIQYNACNDKKATEYVDYLIKEIDFYMRSPHVRSKQFTSVHIGGGSPSVFPVNALEKLFSHLKNTIPEFDQIETTFTGEARSLKRIDLLHLIKDFGWQRLTWGIETMDDSIRRQIGRKDRHQDVHELFEAVDRVGYKGGRCIDIMYHLPGQTVEGFQQEMAQLVETYAPEWIDAYSTVYLPYRPLHRKIIRNQIEQPANAWELLKMREFIYDYLTSKGYHNPLSETYSKEKAPSNYQQGQSARQEVIPIGSAARGNFMDMVSINPDKLEKWKENIDTYGVSTQTLQSIGREGVFDRLMVMWPRAKVLPKTLFRRFSDLKDFKAVESILNRHLSIGVAEKHADHYILNKLGVIWHGNMQTDYIWKSLSPIARLAMNKTLAIGKKDFDRDQHIRPNAFAQFIWANRRRFPRHK